MRKVVRSPSPSPVRNARWALHLPPFESVGGGSRRITEEHRRARAGGLNDPRFGARIRGEELFARHIAQLFSISCRRVGIAEGRFPRLSTAAFRRSGGAKLGLFD
jgi:hypothetical protein